MERYRNAKLSADADREAFWAEQARKIAWFEPPSATLRREGDALDLWFEGGALNTAWLCLEHQIESGRGDQLALIWDSPVTDTVERYTYVELRDRVARVAGMLAGLGVGKGDRVILYLPMVAEAAVAMLACARIGAIHSVVFGGFAARELATRIDDARPDVVLTASCGIEFDKVIPYKPLIDEALAMAEHPVGHCVVLQRSMATAAMTPGRDHDWRELEAAAEPVGWTPVAATDPLYILYTSGTTGKPKGVLRDNGGHAVALNYSMEAVYDVAPGDVFWAASDVGWVVGHSYIVYAPLLRGCTTILYEGKPVRTPDAGAFWRVIAEHGVNVFFVAPTAFRAIRKEDPDAALLGQYDLSSLRRVFVAGERTDPPTYFWLKEILDRPVIDHWWQTETGWPIAAIPAGIEYLEEKPGSAGVIVPGYELAVVRPDGSDCDANETGDVVLRLPLPPGCLPTVWGDHERFVASYLSDYEGCYLTGDGGYLDEDGYLFIMGRTDDVINVAGHRLSTGEMEAVVAEHPAVAECAVFGVADADRGQVPLGLVVLKDGVNVEAADLQSELVAAVRRDIGPFANFKRAEVVERLPKTRSGKILRKVMRQIIDGEPWEMPSTIDDPAILDDIQRRFG